MRSFAAEPRPRRSAGFSLIEVLVALVIAGLALTAVAEVFGSGLDGDRTSGDAATALTLAEGKLAAAGAAEPLRPGSSVGDFAGRFRWRLWITPYADPQRRSTTDFAAPAGPLRLYRVEVAVAWQEGAQRRELTLATLRLGPAPP